MDSLDVARACLRQWFIVVPILALAAVGGWTYGSHRPPVYTATGTVTIFYQVGQAGGSPANAQDDPRVRNPLYVTGGVSLLESALLADLNGPTVARALVAKGDTAKFTLTPNQFNPLIVVEAKGSDPRVTAQTAIDLVSLTETQFTALQKRAGATDNSLYHTFTLTPVSAVLEVLPSKAKFLLAFMAAAVILAGLLAVLAERFAMRRRGSLQHQADGDGDGDGDGLAIHDDVRSLQSAGRQHHPPVN